MRPLPADPPARRPLEGAKYAPAVESNALSADVDVSPATRLRIAGLRTEGQERAPVLDVKCPQLAWVLQDTRFGVRQAAYQVRLSTHQTVSRRDDPGGLLWDSGRVDSGRSIGVTYAGGPLHPRTQYWWTARVWDDTGTLTAWAEPTTFTTGLLANGRWTTPWLAAPADLRLAQGAERVLYFRRRFSLSSAPCQARVFATALGIYQLHINGRRVDIGEQAPGWTDYRTRLDYQSADVTEHLTAGDNHIEIAVAEGWWMGNIAWWGRKNYGDYVACSLQLFSYDDRGRETSLTTGPEWQVGYGVVTTSDMLMGERQDLRQASAAGGVDASGPVFGAAEVVAAPEKVTSAQIAEPIRTLETLIPLAIYRAGPESVLVDFGQHITGRARLRTQGPNGAIVTIRHAEALTADGGIYTANLRTARQEDSFVLAGTPDEILAPQFALHGFRYAQVEGLTVPLTENDIAAEVVHSDLLATGSFHCSHPLINQLQHNIVWSQKGNFIGIPVDCHQRDERLGWTGDMHLFAPTALFNMDCTRFLRCWIRSLADGQLESGSVPDIAPYTDHPQPPRDINHGQAGWGDAIVGVPWELYLHTGDTAVLRELWTPIQRWIAYCQNTSVSLVRDGGVYGDWNNQDRDTPSEVTGTAWFARSLRIAAQIAGILGDEEAAINLTVLLARTRAAFSAKFVSAAGRVGTGTQTCYVVALDNDLVPAHVAAQAVDNLVASVAANGFRPTTGFVGAARLLQTLTKHGRWDVAYRILAQTDFPSWGYQLVNGATTVWEHWDTWRPETGFQDPKMNSFNHFAFAAVGEWLYRDVAGINPDPEHPGYQRTRFRPRPDTFLREVVAHLDTPAGRVTSAWWTDGQTVRLRLAVPPNADAFLELPWVQRIDDVVSPQRGYLGIRQERGGLILQLPSGEYSVSVPYPA